MSKKYLKIACALMVIMGVHTAVQAKDSMEEEEKGCIHPPIEWTDYDGDEPDE